jgi:hypothetical protein
MAELSGSLLYELILEKTFGDGGEKGKTDVENGSFFCFLSST